MRLLLLEREGEIEREAHIKFANVASSVYSSLPPQSPKQCQSPLSCTFCVDLRAAAASLRADDACTKDEASGSLSLQGSQDQAQVKDLKAIM